MTRGPSPRDRDGPIDARDPAATADVAGIQVTRAGRAVEVVLELVCVIALTAMTLLMVADVFFRYVINQPLGSAFELIQVMLAVLIFSGIGLVTLRDEHVTVTLLFDTPWFSGRRRLFRLVTLAITGAAFLILAYRLKVYGDYMHLVGEQSMFLQIPIYPLVYYGAAVIGVCALACGALLLRTWRRRPEAGQ